MAEALKIIGQVVPSTANTAVALYTAPTAAGSAAVIPTIVAANTTATDVKVRVFAYASGGSATTSTALYYDVVVPARDSLNIAVPVTLGPGQVLAVASGTASAVTFTAFGQEITA